MTKFQLINSVQQSSSYEANSRSASTKKEIPPFMAPEFQYRTQNGPPLLGALSHIETNCTKTWLSPIH
jgi:hypothetical protein